MAEAFTEKPIVLLGDVGIGKTSFVKNLMYNSAYQEFKNAIYVYIDLGSEGTLTSDLKAFILEQIKNQLFEKYNLSIQGFSFIKGVYASDIKKFSMSYWGMKKNTDKEL